MLTSVAGTCLYTFLNQRLHLLPQKAIYWEESKLLLIADVHLGKVNHFRKAGIAVPQQAAATDYTTLDFLVNQFPVQEVVFLGDLFHSSANHACADFTEWISQYSHIQFTLIKGNHDILPAAFYSNAGITVWEYTYIKHPFILSHIPITEGTTYYNLTGHIHPAVKLFGKGKQVLTLPCFYFGEHNGILPAFGSFTGKAIIETAPEDRVFAIASNMVKSLN